MTENKLYKSFKVIDGEPILAIVDSNGKIINNNPTKEELKGLEEPYYRKKYTDKKLLKYLRYFEKEYGKPPTADDFKNNSRYPNCITYQRRFEVLKKLKSW